MSILSDVLAGLKATTEWNDLVAAARRIPELEKRIADLEQRLQGGGSSCPSCGQAAYRLIESKPDPVFGKLGGVRRVYAYGSCGFSEESLVE